MWLWWCVNQESLPQSVSHHAEPKMLLTSGRSSSLSVFLVNFGFGNGMRYAISLCGSREYFNGRCPALLDSEKSSMIVGGGSVVRCLNGVAAAFVAEIIAVLGRLGVGFGRRLTG